MALGFGLAASLPSGIHHDQYKNIPTEHVRTIKSDSEPVASIDFDLESSKDQVKNFIAKLLPIINTENKNILKIRYHLKQLSVKDNLTDKDKIFLSNLNKEYKANNINELLEKINVIPPSIAIAQAALESGWGKSSLAKQGNEIYGQKVYNGPAIKSAKDNIDYAKFNSLDDSVKSYVHNLNTHPAYKEFRDIRNWCSKNNKPIHGIDLVKYLSQYSTKHHQYTKKLAKIIRLYHLTNYDKIS